MKLAPRLIEVALPERPAGVVLVLHGGASRRRTAGVSPTQLSVVRMIPIARRIARGGEGRLAVFRVLNSARGWDAEHTPLRDAEWALEQLAGRWRPQPPACLVGHSLGGRAALLACARPQVRSVVALAPWVYPTDTPHGLSGQQVLIVHGSMDRVASSERSAALAQRLSRETWVRYVTVQGGKHSMLRRHGAFGSLAADFATATLLGTPARGAIARLQAGENWIRL